MIKFLNKTKLDIDDINTELLEVFFRSQHGGYTSYRPPHYVIDNVSLLFKNEMQSIIEGIFIQAINSTFNNYIHRDPRSYAINYLLNLGGDNVETCFYKNNKEEKYILPLYTWHLFKADEPHCVKNVTGTRKAITISFKKSIDVDRLMEIIS